MSGEELLKHTVTQEEYDKGRAGCIPPRELEPGALYTARLLLARSITVDTVPDVAPVEAIVELTDITDEPTQLAAIRYLDEDGRPDKTLYVPDLDEAGILYGQAAPVQIFEGYFLSSSGSLEDELDRIVEEVSIPVYPRRIEPEQPRYLQ